MLLKFFAFCVLAYTVFRMLRTLLRTLGRLAASQRPPRSQKDGQWSGPRPGENPRERENVEDANYVDIS